MPKVIYTYDPLDRLIQTAGIRRFYNGSRMTTEIEGTAQRSVFQVGDHVLAEGWAGGSSLLATDLQRSVLHTVNPDKTQPMAYNVYGHRPADSGVASVLGFNGERADPVTGHYVLGNGYRAFNPVLMRFNSPDSWSPFGNGGINCYGYCGGDSVNRVDSSGHFFLAALRKAADSFWEFYRAPTGMHIKATSNYIKLNSDIYVYEQLSKKGQRKIVFDAHGDFENGALKVGSQDSPVSPDKLINLAREGGIDFGKYDAVKLMICHSAEANFAQQVSNLTGLKTKAFKGTAAAVFPGFLVPNMEVGKIYQPMISMRTLRNTGIFKYFPSSQRNYNPVIFFPENHSAIRRN